MQTDDSGHRQNRGFTLMELVVVISIVGVLSVLAAPRFFNRTDFDEATYVQEVASAARYAQKLAVAGGCPVRFILSGSGYQLKQPTNFCVTSDFDRDVLSPGTGTAFSGAAPAGVVISSGSTVTYNSQGGTDLVADFSANVGTQRLVIHSANGYVEIQIP